MLIVGDLARQEDCGVRGSKSGNPTRSRDIRCMTSVMFCSSPEPKAQR